MTEVVAIKFFDRESERGTERCLNHWRDSIFMKTILLCWCVSLALVTGDFAAAQTRADELNG